MKDNVKAMMKFMQDEIEEKENTLIEDVKNDKAFIHNDLIRGMFENKTITSLKLLLYIARVGLANNKRLDKTSYYSIMLEIDDICEYTKISSRTLMKSLTALQQTTVTYFSTDKRRELGLKSRVSLMPKIDDISKNVLSVDMHSDVLNMIKETSNFTPIENLKDIMQIKRVNSIRMLLLLNMINTYTHKKKDYALEQLNFLFDTNYATIYEFERKILKPTKTELDINSSISFNYVKNEDYKRPGIGRKPIKNITISVLEVDSLFALDRIEPETKTPGTNTQEKQKDCIEAPTQDEIDFALDECGLKPIEATVKFEMFKKWESEQGAKRNFKKYLIDGLN